ncbi:hypothetical protein DFJ67_0500 [Asanoa ferruginea]|uniref:Uncharacterized protein n=1 Tax=Asanoa ferruginea TaxID=53367 RepID=A0A3D9ZDN3_9ACTN|nr:hypothetical protein DFJ67_0500 [Asanoa ferruginea]
MGTRSFVQLGAPPCPHPQILVCGLRPTRRSTPTLRVGYGFLVKAAAAWRSVCVGRRRTPLQRSPHGLTPPPRRSDDEGAPAATSAPDTRANAATASRWMTKGRPLPLQRPTHGLTPPARRSVTNRRRPPPLQRPPRGTPPRGGSSPMSGGRRYLSTHQPRKRRHRVAADDEWAAPGATSAPNTRANAAAGAAVGDQSPAPTAASTPAPRNTAARRQPTNEWLPPPPQHPPPASTPPPRRGR